MALINPVNIAFVTLCLIVFIVAQRTWSRMKKATLSKLKEEMFPKLLDNSKMLYNKLSEGEILDEDYVGLLDRGWKKSLHLDFVRYFSYEEGIYSSLKQDLEEYQKYIREWKTTGSGRVKEILLEKKVNIKKKLIQLTEAIEEIM